MPTVDELVINIRAQTDDFTQNVDKAESQIVSLTNSTEEAGTSAGNFGTSMTVAERKMGSMGTTLGVINEGVHELHRGWRDVTMAIGMVSGVIGVIGIAAVAVEAITTAFSTSTVAAKDYTEQLKAMNAEISKIEGKTTSFEQQKAMIMAKYAPDSKEYKEAMLNLQEQSATEAYTKFGDKTALGELTQIQTQRGILARGTPSLQDQYLAAHAGIVTATDSYQYGISPSYLSGAPIAAAGEITKYQQAIRAEGQQELATGIRNSYLGTGAGTNQTVPSNTGLVGDKYLLLEVKDYLAKLSREPKIINMTNTIYTNDDPQHVANQMAMGTSQGLNVNNIKSAEHG
jgi:hypothetical protein